MADTAAVSGAVDVVLSNSSSHIHAHLHHRAFKHKTHSVDENIPDEKASYELPAVAVEEKSNYKSICSPTNLSTNFRCERCDNFETNSRATLLLHVVQCISSPGRLKSEKVDPENLSLNAIASDLNSNSPKYGLSDAVPAVGGASANGSSRKVFECDVCNMKFSNGANMRRHKMRHTGVKPYECRVCQKRFFRKDHLAEHFTTHTKTLPYHCPICNRGFQRQIAMRAHFQNEHVGQHDLVKTCPLCSYRAGSMKSLRIHFHNRHGIDLDNPGQGGSSSLLFALESQASQAAAAANNFTPNLNPAADATASVNAVVANNQSNSIESLRSTENSTPPIHFLTPHVEISMPKNSSEVFNESSAIGEESVDVRLSNNNPNALTTTHTTTNACASPRGQQDELLNCNTKSAASNFSALQMSSPPRSNQYDNHILPSISLIPIKQEPAAELLKTDAANSDESTKFDNSFTSADHSKLSSLIKVSPLKSLLREDLKRRIFAKANNRIIRNAVALENNNAIKNAPARSSVSCNSTAICSGTITSSGQETESAMLNRKQILTCFFCGIEFPDETLYFLHKGCHCESNPWKCNICGEQCNNVYEFNSHLLSKSHQ